MTLKQLDGYELKGQSVVTPFGFQNIYQLKLNFDKSSLDLSLNRVPSTYALGALRYRPEANTRYHSVLRARQNGLKPFSLKTVYIDPTSYDKNPELLKSLKDQIETKGRFFKRKKTVDLIGHEHDGVKFDGYFELEDGSKHNIICSIDLIGALLTYGSNMIYRGEPVTGLSGAGKYRAVRISTDARNAFTECPELDLYLIDSFDLKTGAVKNVKMPDGRYSAEGLLNELSLASKSGLDVKIKEVDINDFSNGAFSSDVTVEKDGKSELYKMPASNGLLVGKLFDATILVEDQLVAKMKQIEQQQIQLMQQRRQMMQDDKEDSDDKSSEKDKDKREPN